MDMARVLALDPGASFGWACTAKEVTPDPHLVEYFLQHERVNVGRRSALVGNWDLNSVNSAGERFDLVSDLVRNLSPDVVYYELTPGLRGMASVWFNGYLATVSATAFRSKAQFVGVNVSTWKKDMIGHGRANKLEIRSRAIKDYDVPPDLSQDAIDALWVLAWGLKQPT